MKKTITITSLIAASLAFAQTKGSLEFSNDTDTTITRSYSAKREIKNTKTTPKIVLDMGVKDSGFRFGGEYYLKELKPFTNSKKESKGNIWAEYTFNKVEDTSSFAKLTFDDEKN